MIHKTISISYIIYNFVTLNLISIFLYGIFILFELYNLSKFKMAEE